VEVSIGLAALMNFKIRFDDGFMERFDVVQFFVLMKPQGHTTDRHVTSQFSGSMRTHPIGNNKYVALLGPRFFTLGQYDQMSILVVGPPHTDVGDGSVLQAIDPFERRRIHVLSLLRESARPGYRAFPSEIHHASVSIRDLPILLVSREVE
jgi:hypothetical protein